MVNETLNRLHAIITGDVQGVGFRASAQQIARQLALGGTVCNRDDGSVELVAHGTKDRLEQLLAMLQKKYAGHDVKVTAVYSHFEGPLGEFKITFR